MFYNIYINIKLPIQKSKKKFFPTNVTRVTLSNIREKQGGFYVVPPGSARYLNVYSRWFAV